MFVSLHISEPLLNPGGRSLDEANIPFSHHPISDQSPAGLGVTLLTGQMVFLEAGGTELTRGAKLQLDL